MIRSHTKGIYVKDADSGVESAYDRVESLAARVDKKAATKNYGFARCMDALLGSTSEAWPSIFNPFAAPSARGEMCIYSWRSGILLRHSSLNGGNSS